MKKDFFFPVSNFFEGQSKNGSHFDRRVVLFPAKFSWEGFPANSKICWEGRESTNSKLQVKCNLPRARTATFPDWEHDLATPRGRGRIARQKAERCHGWHGRRPGAHLRGQQQPRFVFEYCEHRVRIAVPGHELHASVAGGGFTLRAFPSGGLAQLQLADGCRCARTLLAGDCACVATQHSSLSLACRKTPACARSVHRKR